MFKIFFILKYSQIIPPISCIIARDGCISVNKDAITYISMADVIAYPNNCIIFDFIAFNYYYITNIRKVFL